MGRARRRHRSATEVPQHAATVYCAAGRTGERPGRFALRSGTATGAVLTEKELVYVIDETTVYEPPALVEAGEFEKVTLGPRGWGFEFDVRCLIWCD